MSQIITAHNPQPTPAPSVVSSASMLSSPSSSLAPSESISQRGKTPSAPRNPSSQKHHKLSQSFLNPAVSQPSSRDNSPLPDVLADGELVDYGDKLAIDPSTLLSSIPKHLAPVPKFPEPLPGPIYLVKRAVPVETQAAVDSSQGVPQAKRTGGKSKNKARMGVKDLPLADQTIVRAAISRMSSLLTVCCGFPDETTCWILANMANDWACRKYGRSLALTQDSEYKTLVSDQLLYV